MNILISHHGQKEVFNQYHNADSSNRGLVEACSKVCTFLQSKSDPQAFDIGDIYRNMCKLWTDTDETTHKIPKALFDNCRNDDHRIACAEICKELMDRKCDMNAKIALTYISSDVKIQQKFEILYKAGFTYAVSYIFHIYFS